jgi:hypothetical protein
LRVRSVAKTKSFGPPDVDRQRRGVEEIATSTIEEGDDADRENSPAYQILPPSAKRVFAAIERAISDGDARA